MTPKTQFNTLKLLIIQSLLMSKVNLEADATPIGVMVHLYEKSNGGESPVKFGSVERAEFAQNSQKAVNTIDKAVTFLKNNGFIVKVEKNPGLFNLGEIFNQVNMVRDGDKIKIEISLSNEEG